MSLPETGFSVQIRELSKASARRSELEIKMDVLRVAASGIDRPTQIMYKANLSWIALQANLKSLVGKVFLREEDLGNRKRYELTQRGYEVLTTFERVVESMGQLPPPQSPKF